MPLKTRYVVQVVVTCWTTESGSSRISPAWAGGTAGSTAGSTAPSSASASTSPALSAERREYSSGYVLSVSLVNAGLVPE